MEHLRKLVERLQGHSYHVRLSKCEFLRSEVEFLGHRLSAKGLSTAEEKVNALNGWQPPLKSAKQVRQFFGIGSLVQVFHPPPRHHCNTIIQTHLGENHLLLDECCHLSCKHVEEIGFEGPMRRALGTREGHARSHRRLQSRSGSGAGAEARGGMETCCFLEPGIEGCGDMVLYHRQGMVSGCRGSLAAMARILGGSPLCDHV